MRVWLYISKFISSDFSHLPDNFMTDFKFSSLKCKNVSHVMTSQRELLGIKKIGSLLNWMLFSHLNRVIFSSFHYLEPFNNCSTCLHLPSVHGSTACGVRWPQSTLSLLCTICSLLCTICSLLCTICSLLCTICSLLCTICLRKKGCGEEKTLYFGATVVAYFYGIALFLVSL